MSSQQIMSRVTTATTHEDWKRSDAYHNSFLLPHDAALEAAQKQSKEAGLPNISVSTAQGKLLNLVARSIQAKRVLEVGTLGGYSSIWIAQALPADGELITCELDPKHAEIARQNIARAGFESKVKILLGPAVETLPTVSADPPFDLAFIDADKPNNAPYFTQARRLVRKGGVIIVDNVVRNGRVADPQQNTADVQGVRALLELVKNDSGVDATTIATVGEKGFDGFMYVYVK